jgi:hypothetical protein
MTGHGAVEIDGQVIAYEWLEVDVRTEEQRRADEVAGCLGGDPAVVLPGHGQTVASPKKLAEAAAALSRGGVAWCINVLAPTGGDPVKARALSLIVRSRIAALFPASDRPELPPAQPVRATLIGWSHGGGEALRSAEVDPSLFPRVAGLCAAGLIERRTRELLTSFLFELMNIAWTRVARRDGPGLRTGARVGFDILRGVWQDMIRSRSPRWLLDDMRWASRKVPGAGYSYGGDVALVFARDDTVIRWRAVFPGCATPEEIPAHLDAYRHAEFPNAARLQVAVIEGDHLSPESAAEAYASCAMRMLGQ